MNSVLSPLFGISVRKSLAKRWPRLYRVAYSWCHDPHLARDLAQETIARALRSRRRMPDDKALDTWLFRILHNCWCDQLRRARPMLDSDALELQSDFDQEECYYSDQVRALVANAVASLSSTHRAVFALVVMEGFTYEQAADTLEIPIGTVMSRLARARAQLRERLQSLTPQPARNSASLRRIK